MQVDFRDSLDVGREGDALAVRGDRGCQAQVAVVGDALLVPAVVVHGPDFLAVVVVVAMDVVDARAGQPLSQSEVAQDVASELERHAPRSRHGRFRVIDLPENVGGLFDVLGCVGQVTGQRQAAVGFPDSAVHEVAGQYRDFLPGVQPQASRGRILGHLFVVEPQVVRLARRAARVEAARHHFQPSGSLQGFPQFVVEPIDRVLGADRSPDLRHGDARIPHLVREFDDGVRALLGRERQRGNQQCSGATDQKSLHESELSSMCSA